jgi:hypothetical protein
MGFSLPSPDEMPEPDDDLDLGKLNDPAVFKAAFGKLVERVDKGFPSPPSKGKATAG